MCVRLSVGVVAGAAASGCGCAITLLAATVITSLDCFLLLLAEVLTLTLWPSHPLDLTARVKLIVRLREGETNMSGDNGGRIGTRQC